MKIYLNTSVVISLTDPYDIFHKQSLEFVQSFTKHKIEIIISTPFIVELGRIVEIRGVERSLNILDTIDNLRLHFRNMDMKNVWNLSQVYLDANILTVRHRLDLFHYAAASLLNCTHIASWNRRQFNERIAMRVNTVNSERKLSTLIVQTPNNIGKEKFD